MAEHWQKHVIKDRHATLSSEWTRFRLIIYFQSGIRHLKFRLDKNGLACSRSRDHAGGFSVPTDSGRLTDRQQADTTDPWFVGVSDGARMRAKVLVDRGVGKPGFDGSLANASHFVGSGESVGR